MTIDEAIKHCLEVAEKEEQFCVQDDRSCLFQKSHAECAADQRQLAEWLTKLKEAKRLLKAAVEDINVAEACNTCKYYPVINSKACQIDDCYKWRYADEALKLIGGSENG